MAQDKHPTIHAFIRASKQRKSPKRRRVGPQDTVSPYPTKRFNLTMPRPVYMALRHLVRKEGGATTASDVVTGMVLRWCLRNIGEIPVGLAAHLKAMGAPGTKRHQEIPANATDLETRRAHAEDNPDTCPEKCDDGIIWGEIKGVSSKCPACDGDGTIIAKPKETF